jgi:predicted flap endonuclease-1-like 5' DNA nuclease
MKAICENDLVLDCAGFKAIDSGVVLLGTKKKGAPVGFVPNDRLRYLLPDDVVEREHERLGLPAPTIDSSEELERRLADFSAEIESLTESLDRQVRDLIDESGTVGEGDPERRARLDERRRTIDRQLETVRTRSEQFRQLSDVAEEPTDAETTPDLDDIKGLGPTYRDRLHGAGITSVAALADEDPERVADAANAPESRAREWVDRAKELRSEAEATA